MARTKLTLQDVARAAADNNGGRGGRSLQRIAEKKGLTLSFTTVDRILAGKYESTPQKPTIEALAVLADMQIEDVYAAAGLPLPMAPLSDQLPDGSDQLTVHQRRVVLDVIRGFIRDNARMAELEDELHHRPPHPDEMLRQLAEFPIEEIGDDGLEELLNQLALLIHDPGTTQEFLAAEARARAELARRNDAPAGGGAVEDLPEQNGVTPDARPWEQDEYGLAAKRGRNRGRESREQQDREAEDGGA